MTQASEHRVSDQALVLAAVTSSGGREEPHTPEYVGEWCPLAIGYSLKGDDDDDDDGRTSRTGHENTEESLS